MKFTIHFPGEREPREVDCEYVTRYAVSRPLSGPERRIPIHEPVIPGYQMKGLLGGAFMAIPDR